ALVERGHPAVLPEGGLLLGLGDVVRVHRHLRGVGRQEWVPIVAARDGFHGKFVDTSTGAGGSWCERLPPREGQCTSLYAYFEDVADQLAGLAPAEASGAGRPRPEDHALRLWARANGFPVSDRGRIPRHIREAYEAPR